MESNRFKELLDELDGNSLQTLKEKNARYAKNGDCLHNFRSGAEIMGCTPAQACWRYMAKHLADLRNKIDANDFSDREDFLEKCQDSINYFRFLWCIGNDMPGENVSNVNMDKEDRWEVSLFFPTVSSASLFICGMDRICADRGVITVTDVYKHQCMDYEQSDYHRGWHSTDEWAIERGPDFVGFLVKIPKAVNI